MILVFCSETFSVSVPLVCQVRTVLLQSSWWPEPLLISLFLTPFQDMPSFSQACPLGVPKQPYQFSLQCLSLLLFPCLEVDTSFLLFTCIHSSSFASSIYFPLFLFYVVHQILFLYLICSSFLSLYNYSC